jgi:Zn-dependent protease
MGDSGWWFLSAWERSPMEAIAWVFWVIVSVCLHELAHGVAAIRLGDNTPRYTGHMTWNPLVHMGRTALIMFAIFGFTWGAMPVNPSRFQHRYGDAIVAFAGPLCNLLQFLILMPLLLAWIKFADRPGMNPDFYVNMQIFLRIGCVINIVGFLFNLIPVPPLDGSRILADFHPPFNELWRGKNAEVFAVVAFVALFLFGGRYVWGLTYFIFATVLNFGKDLLSIT